jgi:hypothetical protein
MNKSAAQSTKILKEAIEKTDQVQEELHDAAEALNGANAVLSSPMAASAVAGAVKQNIDAESKVQSAAHELEVVKDLIQEAQVAQAAGESARNAGEGTASILAYFEGRRAQARDDDARDDKKA